MNDDKRHQTPPDKEAKRLIRRTRRRVWIRRFRRKHPEVRAREYQRLKADPKRYAQYLEKQKLWKKAHPDYHRLWVKKHPQAQYPARKTYIMAWKAAHPERQLEYARRWRLKKGIKVGGQRRLKHEQSLQKMLEIPSPFTAKQFAIHVGITCGGACNLFRTLLMAGKIRMVRQEQNTRFYEVHGCDPSHLISSKAVNGNELSPVEALSTCN